MKEKIYTLDLEEKEIFIKDKVKVVTNLSVWADNNLSEAFLDDTLFVMIEEVKITETGEREPLDENKDIAAIKLTKHQAIILKNYLDTYIQLAQTYEEMYFGGGAK